MQANRILPFVLLLFVLVGVGVWALRSDQQVGPAPGAASAPAPGGTAELANGDIGRVIPAPVTDASLERSSAPIAAANANVPAILGRLVDANDKPVADAEVIVGAGMSMAAASGQFDFSNFDANDLADMDPQQMMGVMSKQALASVRTTTGADGRFRLVPTGMSRGLGLRAVARGFALFDRPVVRPADADIDLGDLRLDRGGIVIGRVVDPAGNGIEGAVVSRLLDIEKGPMGQFEMDTPEMQAAEQMRFGDICKTDVAGRFELAHMPPGEFTLRARHPEHPSSRQTGEVAAGATISDLTITMPVGAEIHGVVVGVPENTKGLRVMAAKKPGASAVPNPLMGMLGDDPTELLGDMGMSFGERSAEIDASGEFVLRGLRQDAYRIWVSQVGAGFAGQVVCSERLEVAAGSHGVQLRYEAGVRVTFVVVDAKSGAPIERLWVSDRLRGGGGFGDMMAMGMPGNTRQRDYPGGAVTLANLRPKPKQKLTVELSAIGFGDWKREDVELPQVGVLDLGTIRLEPKPVVQVTVIAADTGAAVVGARVKVVDAPAVDSNPFARLANMRGGGGTQSGKTDDDGRCVLNARIDAEGFVEVDSAQHAPFVSEAIHFPASGRTEYTARLLTGGRVEVTVVDPAGKPVADVPVEQRDLRGDTKRGKTDAKGLARFDHLAPGKHDFRLGENAGGMAGLFAAARAASDPGATAAENWQSVDVVDRGAATLQLVKSPTARLHGVVRENGVPLAGARINFVEGGGSDEQNDIAQQMMGGMLDQFGGKNGRSAKTDDAGAFSLAELPEGEHRLRITHKERALPTTIAITLRNGDNVQDVELDMTAARGVVLDPDGNPISGARVSVRVVKDTATEVDDLQDTIGSMMPMGLGTPSGIKTELDGTFLLRGVEPDVKLKVLASAKGFAPAQVTTSVVRGTTSSPLQLRLGVAGRIKVTARTEAPFAAVRARFTGEGDGQAPVIQLLRKGKCTLDGLRPGTWEVSFQGMQDAGTGEQTRTVAVVAGGTAEVEF